MAEISISPSEAVLELGQSVQLAATTTPTGASVAWTVEPDGIGTIGPDGIYTAPEQLEKLPFIVSIRATLTHHPDVSAASILTLQPRTVAKPARIEALAGTIASGPAGDLLAEPLIARVLAEDGRPLAAVKVTFALGSWSASAVSNEAGLARAVPQLPKLMGRVEATATVEGLEPALFPLEVVAAAPATISATHPTKSGRPGAVMSEPIVVSVADAFGNATGGVRITTAVADFATATPVGETTDAAGTQSFSIQLAPVGGLQTFTFTVEGTRLTTSIDIEAVGGEAVALVIVDGDAQEAPIRTTLARPLVVRALDAEGYPAVASTLAWAASDGVTLDGAEVSPSVDGLVSAKATLPRVAGLATITCSVPGTTVPAVTFVVRVQPGPSQRLQLVSGGNQTTTAGSPFGAPFLVRATDAFSNGVEGVDVAFSVVAGGGSVAPSTVRTGVDGIASAVMTAGPAGQQRFRATAAGLTGSPIEAASVAIAESDTVLEIVSGQDQTAPGESALPSPLVVRVLRSGVPASGVAVSFAVSTGGGSIRPASSLTAGDGTARAIATLGAPLGSQRFAASVSGARGGPVYFSATATAPLPVVFRAVSGAGQIAAPGAALAQPLVVEALDRRGLPAAGWTVRFAGPSGSVVQPSEQPTAIDGRAAATVALGSSQGRQEFTATIPGTTLTPVVFVVEAVPLGATVRMRVTAGAGQSAEVGATLPVKMQVTLVGTDGRGVPGIAVTFKAEAERATVDPPVVNTDEEGRAETTITLGKPVGTQRFTATADSVVGSPVTLTANALAAPAQALVVSGGDGQTAPSGSALPVPLAVRALDRMGNAVGGVAIAFRPGIGGGSVAPASATSDPAGRATTLAQLGPTLGSQTFLAESSGLPPVAFTAFATSAVARVSVAPKAPVLEAGGSVRFSATAVMIDDSSADVTAVATWTSSTPGVLGVGDSAGSKGVASALSAGSATVSATYQGVSGSTPATVRAAQLRTIVLLPATTSLVVGTSRTLRAMGTYSDGHVVEVTDSASWTTSDGRLATVSDTLGTKGLLEAIAPGNIDVTASLSGIVGTRRISIAQAPLTRLEVTPTGVTQPAGTSVAFRATATFANGTVQDVTRLATWSSSDVSFMTVQNAPADAGRATLLAQGSAEVRVAWQGSSATQPVSITAATVRSMAIVPRQANLSVRDQLQLRLVAAFSDGSVADVANLAAWDSSATSIADVSNATGTRGLVTAIAAGRADVTARLFGQTASLALTVDSASVQRIRVSVNGGRQARCPKGGLLRLSADALYSDGQTADISDQVSWSVSPPTLAVVGQGQQGGIVQCLAEGTATVTAQFEGRADSQQLTITAATLTTLSIAPTTAQLARGDMRSFYATGTYSDGTRRDLTALATWTSSAPSVLTVSNAAGARGRATAAAAGSATLSATYDGVTGTASATVTSATLTFVVVSPANPTVGLRDRFVQFNATAVYSDGSTQDVTEQAVWTAADPQLALVSNDPATAGWVIIQGRQGSCEVSASYGGKKGSTTLTVR